MTMLDSSPTPAPTIDPRLRQRWIDVRREEGRRRLRLIVVLLAVVALLGAGLGVLYTPLVKVRHVQIVLRDVPAGSDLTAAKVKAQAGLDRERLMINVASGREAGLIEQLPWVASAQVTREWPGTIRIVVTARRPVAEVARTPGNAASGLAVLDATGRVLALLPAGSAPAGSAPAGSAPEVSSSLAALPVLASLPAPGAPGTSILPPAGGGSQVAAEELATAAALPPALEPRISTITISASGLALRVGSVMVLFGDAGELAQKVTSLETILTDVSLRGIGVIDLRVPDRPALTGSPSNASLSTTAGG